MALHESGQMYLEAIYVLLEKKDKIRAIDVGAYLGYTKPSVSRAVGILKKGGFIAIDAGGYITLTPEGREIAEELYERSTAAITLWRDKAKRRKLIMKIMATDFSWGASAAKYMEMYDEL